MGFRLIAELEGAGVSGLGCRAWGWRDEVSYVENCVKTVERNHNCVEQAERGGDGWGKGKLSATSRGGRQLEYAKISLCCLINT